MQEGGAGSKNKGDKLRPYNINEVNGWAFGHMEEPALKCRKITDDDEEDIYNDGYGLRLI